MTLVQIPLVKNVHVAFLYVLIIYPTHKVFICRKILIPYPTSCFLMPYMVAFSCLAW
jgi:hypothetical protein